MAYCCLERHRGEKVTAFHLHREDTGAFVLARDLDEVRKGAAPLGSNEADARLGRLREGVGVFELDAEQLAYVVLKPGGAFASVPRPELVRRILRRADAWTFRGKRARWVEELVASLEAS